MRTVCKAALAPTGEYLAEIMAYLLALHIERTKALNAGNVDYVASGRQVVHAAVGGCMHSRKVRLGYSGSLGIRVRHEGIDESRFAHSRITCQQRNAVAQQAFYAFAYRLQGRNAVHLITDSFIHSRHVEHLPCLLGRIRIDFVEHQCHRHPVGLGRSKEAVDERRIRLRACHRYEQQHEVDVGRKNLALLRQVGGAAYYIVAPVAHGGYHAFAACAGRYLHVVANGHGVGGAYAAQAEISAHGAFHLLAAVSAHGVRASRSAYYGASH